MTVVVNLIESPPPSLRRIATWLLGFCLCYLAFMGVLSVNAVHVEREEVVGAADYLDRYVVQQLRDEGIDWLHYNYKVLSFKRGWRWKSTAFDSELERRRRSLHFEAYSLHLEGATPNLFLKHMPLELEERKAVFAIINKDLARVLAAHQELQKMDVEVSGEPAQDADSLMDEALKGLRQPKSKSPPGA